MQIFYGEIMVADFTSLLKDAGISKAELARRFDMNPRTISAWRASPPQYVMAYLTLLIQYNKVR